jgi:hypothetical protein
MQAFALNSAGNVEVLGSDLLHGRTDFVVVHELSM